MNTQVLADFLNRRPFDPFRIRLSSGDIYDIRHPEAALLLRTGLYVAPPAENGNLPDRAVYCALLHIAAVESVASA